MNVAPFDVAALPTVSRAEIEARAQLRSARVPDAKITAALETLLGCEVALAATRALPFERGPVEHLRVAFAPAHDPARAFVVAVEPALARELVSRALKHPSNALVDPAKAPGPDVRGALAAVLHAALRASGAALRIVPDAGTPAFTAFLAVTVAGSTYDACVGFPRGVLVPGEVDLDRWGEVPISLQIVATSCLATRAELEALEPGDMLVPPAGWLDEGVDLVAPGEERGLRARLAFGNKVVLQTEPSTNHSWEPPSMPADSNKPIDVALEAPVVVRIELGSVEMKARDWAALTEGDVISTGAQFNGRAVLRIGGVAVAHGDLVTVDGETGVRIVGTIKR